jgi:Lrp/AsnC family transcriptional regulator, leucine-responsive regulatory protein
LSNDQTLDSIDWRILQALQVNARVSFSELGRIVGLTQPAISERVRRMEAGGIITGYHTMIDYTKVGFTLMAFMRISVPSERCAWFGGLLREVPEVLEAHRLTGDDSYIVKVIVRSVAHLEALIDQLSPYGQPKTALVLSSAVTWRSVEQALADMD